MRVGIKTRTGKNFSNSTINNIIHNLTYTGVLRSGETRSRVIEELQIIPPHIFEKAQDIMSKRVSDAADSRVYPMNTESRSLLNGKIYCADCGSRLIVVTNGRFVIDNGVQQKRLRYNCYGKYAKLADCQGQTGYSATRLDSLVDGLVRHFFERMQNIPKSEVVNSSLIALKQEKEVRYKTTQRECAKVAADLAGLKEEVIKAIRGESKFSSDLLSELIAQTERNLAENESLRDVAKRELDVCQYSIEEMQVRYDEVISWTELYDAAEMPAKKMIIASLINRIDVGVDYQLHIDLNINLEHFNIQFDFCTHGLGRTA